MNIFRLQEHERQGRSDSKRSMQQEELKDGITTVVGAALGEQQVRWQIFLERMVNIFCFSAGRGPPAS